ncbi:TPA: restriction endonuclease subunit S [Vibrio cholerae]|nr:restriction endonuclease subunit S [Vibrio cholerae]
MASEWESYTIEELASSEKSALATGPFGSAISAKFFVDAGFPVIRGSNLSTLTSERMSDEGLVFVSDEKAAEFKRSVVRKGDLIFTCWGTINQVGLIDSRCRYPEYIISNKQMKVTLDTSKADPLFVYYYFSSPAKQREILQNGIGAAVPGFNLGQLRSHTLRLPPLSLQKKISSFIDALDSKITLNRQINQTLEQMAQTLFKSWFVDFDPVMDNALDAGNPIPDELQHRAEARKVVRESEGFKPLPEDVRQLFPDAFEESELGWVPKGWGVSTAGDEFTVKGGSTPSTKNAEFWEGGDIHWTSPKDLSGKAEKIMLDTERKITAAGLKKITSGLLPENSVLMSSRAPIGYLALAKIPVAINQGYIAIPSTTRLSQEYALYWLDSSIDEIKGIAGGTTFAEISKHTFKSIKMIVPDSKVTDIFSNLAKGYLDKITLNVKEVATLTKLRDTLLPKLISGELRLDDVELAVE